MVRVLPLCLLLLAGCAASVPEWTGPRTGDWRATCDADMAHIATAVERYRAIVGTYPRDLAELEIGPAGWPAQWAPLLPRSVPLTDPWQAPYGIDLLDHSLALLTGLDFQVVSAGADRRFGTEDDIRAPQPRALYTPGLSPAGPANRPPE